VPAVSTGIAGFIDLFRSPSRPGTNNAIPMKFLVASRIRVFRRVEVQSGVLGILLLQALAFQAASHTLANQLDQLFQRALGWRLNALKGWRSIVVIHVDAIQEQDVEMYIEVAVSRSSRVHSCSRLWHLASSLVGTSILANS
jgi:hypothetical protein